MKAYKLQSIGYDTVQANLALGFESDYREYDDAAEILKSMGIHQVKLLTNNPLKVEKLREQGIEVCSRVSIEVGYNKHNATYLMVKKEKMNHLLKLSNAKLKPESATKLQAVDQ